MRVVFRADGSVAIGTGHVMRCLSLARELAEGGATVEFVCRPHAGHLAEHIRNEGYAVHLLAEAPPAVAAGGKEDPPHAAWLGTDWKTDARQTTAAILSGGGPADWLVLDHYALDARWQREVRPAAGRILVIDDLADRPHACDALVDHNLYPSLEIRYDALAPAACRRLLGPAHALLRGEFREARRRRPSRGGQVRRILFFFGGADPTGETLKGLDAFESLGRRDVSVDVVVGSANPHHEAIRRRCEGDPAFTYHFQARNMAELMAGADLALGAGGTATWERCCLSLPTLAVTIAENQRLLAETAHARGIMRYLGHHDKVGSKEIAAALKECLEDPAGLAAMSAKAGAAVDGLGAPRVAAAILYGSAAESGGAGQAADLRIRPAGPGDMRLYHGWANDPAVRGNSFSPDPIPLENHEKWFLSKLADPRAGLYVLECGGEPAGQIRFDAAAAAGEGVEIDFSVAAGFRGRGLGVELLRRGTEAFQQSSGRAATFAGVVKKRNPASAKAFLAAGFALSDTQLIGGQPCLVFRKTLPGL